MPANRQTWAGNLLGHSQPLVMLGRFQAGSTREITRGQILILTGGNWVPLGSDAAMNGVIAVANEDVLPGDPAGYYEIIVPRPGDMFEYDLLSPEQVAVGAPLYYSTSTRVKTSGTNVLARSVEQSHYPRQNHAISGGGDAGTTLGTVSRVRMCFMPSASYYNAFNPL